MTPDQFADRLRQRSQQIAQAYASRWPRIMGKLAIDHFQDNFRRAGYIDTSLEPWEQTLRQQLPFNGAAGRYTPLLSRSNHLMRSIDARPSHGATTVFADTPYAAAQNDGATIPITPQMRRFFWAKHTEAKQSHGKYNPEATFWRNMAITKKQLLRIPKRQFIGPSRRLTQNITQTLLKDLSNILQS